MSDITLSGPHEILLVFASDDREEVEPQGPGGAELPNTGCLRAAAEVGDDLERLLYDAVDEAGFAHVAIYKVQVTGFNNKPVIETPPDEAIED
jgi:hypothetical protein